MAVVGAGASFKIGDASNVLTEIADKLENISNSGEAEELNASVFSPGSNVSTKIVAFGAVERRITLSGWWDLTIDTLFESISGLQDRNFEYGPEGTASGKRKYSGTLNVGIWNGPGEQNVNGFIPFTIELAIVTRTVGTF